MQYISSYSLNLPQMQHRASCLAYKPGMSALELLHAGQDNAITLCTVVQQDRMQPFTAVQQDRMLPFTAVQQDRMLPSLCLLLYSN